MLLGEQMFLLVYFISDSQRADVTMDEQPVTWGSA